MHDGYVTSSDDLALSFGAAADAYDLARPGYPDAIVDWLLAGADGPVIDLGAGTGKLTRSFVERGAEVIAVEPDDAMRDRLASQLLSADVRAGTAEDIPVPAGVAGLVVLGQAWHWVDVPRACTEVARVLRRPGRLGLVWNYRDEADEWVARLGQAFGGVDSGGKIDEIRTTGPSVDASFGEPERQIVAWEHILDVDTLVALAASRSYVIRRAPEQRAQVLDLVRELGEERADADGKVRLPYQTYAYRFGLEKV